MSEKRLKVLLLSSEVGSWIDADEAFLRKVFDVDRRSARDAGVLSAMLACDIVFVWFASLRVAPWILTAAILRKRIVIVAGGFDVIDPVRRGSPMGVRQWLSKLIRRVILGRARRVIAVSDCLRKEAERYIGIDSSRLQVIPLGFPTVDFPLEDVSNRRIDVISVFSAGPTSWKVKGLDFLVEAARRNPGLRFHHMGELSGEEAHALRARAPANLRFEGWKAAGTPEFWRTLGDAKVILQLSRYESFCAAVVEGALAGCRPIVSDGGALPETIAGFGRVVPLADWEEFSRTVADVLSRPMNPAEIRARAGERYPFEARARALIQVFEEVQKAH